MREITRTPSRWSSRRRVRWTAGIAVLVGLVGLAVAWTAYARSATTAPSSQTPLDPKSLFVDTFRCSTCHSVAAAGVVAKARSEKIRGGDLSGYRAKPGEDPAPYLRKKAQVRGETHRVEFLGTDEELKAVLDWLGSLEVQSGSG